MQNYYEILGLTTGAEITEVKIAFRQLAKLYHPDVNPDGKGQFTIIVRAYEVLSDPHLKYSYDYKLGAGSNQRQQETKRPTKEKNWRFDDREMKRRQYYNDHIRQYEKKSAAPKSETVTTSNYNEFKYVLFATPLAVILFLGIMTLASENKKETTVVENTNQKTPPTSDLKMGDAPFVWYFGSQQYDAETGQKLSIKNLSGSDLVVILLSDNNFVRSCFINDGYEAQIEQIPGKKIEMRYMSGNFFKQDQKHSGTSVTGGFTENMALFKTTESILFNEGNQLTLLPGINEGFTMITAPLFFKK